jgi:hypothetical protein
MLLLNNHFEDKNSPKKSYKLNEEDWNVSRSFSAHRRLAPARNI